MTTPSVEDLLCSWKLQWHPCVSPHPIGNCRAPHHPPPVLISSGNWEVTGWVCGCWSSWMGTALVSFGWLHCHMSWFPILKHIDKLTCLERAVFRREKAPCEGYVFPAILCPLPDIRMVTSYSFIIFFLLFHLICLEQSFNEQRDFQKRVCLSCTTHLWGSGPQPSCRARFDRVSPLQSPAANLLVTPPPPPASQWAPAASA